MKNVMNGSAIAETVAATHVARIAGLRTLILELVNESQYTSEDEKAVAAQRVAATQSLDTLTKWYTNTLRELADREESFTPVVYATASQKEDIIRLLNHPLTTRHEKTKCLLNINRLTQ